MLRTRVLTALLLLPLVVGAIFTLPVHWFMLLLIPVFIQGSVEYQRLAGYSDHSAGLMLIILQTLILIALYWFQDFWISHFEIVITLSCAAWLIMFSRLYLYSPEARPDKRYRLVSFLTAIVSLTSGWLSLCWIRIQADGSWLILLLLLIVWAADTGAYFTGKTMGKNKLAPRISPGKTREGLVGGLILAPLIAIIAVNLMPLEPIETIPLIIFSLIAALVSAAGVLLISMHKRISGFKDSGNLLPGHGGVLDRVDSLIAASPFFALGLMVWSH